MIEQKSLTPEELKQHAAAEVARKEAQPKSLGWPPNQRPAEQQSGTKPAGG